MRYAKPKESEALKMLFGWGLLRFIISFQITSGKENGKYLNIICSILLLSRGNNWKVLWLTLTEGTLLHWCVQYVVDGFGIKLT